MTSIPATSGIYKITCTVMGKFYIGSAVNLQRRWKDHRCGLNHGTHENPKLQASWNKYGKDAFIFEVLELVLPMSLTAREQYWLDKLKPFGKKGFNIAKVAGSWYGLKHSAATVEKMKSRTLSPEAKANLRNIRLGSTASIATRKRMRASRLGKTHHPDVIKKMCLAQDGHPVKAETRAKLRDANADNMKTLIVTSPDGTEQVIHGISNFCREQHLDYSSLMRVANGRYKQHHGWKARFPETDAS